MKNQREPIAIIGMGCRFPGNINNPEEFWNFLKDGRDAITDVPADRWKNSSFYDPDPNKAGKIKAKKGGFIEGVDLFDAEFFDKFPAEAERIDPQQRFLLEVTYQAMEDAGIKMEQVSNSRTGVYMGVFMNDYWDIQASSLQKDNISPHVAMGVSLTAIANRISYVYNLKGPSMTIDTACSSSLVCVHLACQSIWNGESKMAFAGGVNLMLRPESSIMMSKGNFLSPDGYCKSFDSRANGYVRSEGCGVIVLKPLSEAVKDGDQVYAVIRGSAVNQDGHTEDGFTVPSVESQIDMLRTAYEDAGIDPKSVTYVEAHGTGTPVGDPIETKAFGAALGSGRSAENKLVIGSVKSNIGHLEAAAGIAGLIKLALILRHKQIPANLHFQNPNPKIPFDEYKLRVPTQLEPVSKNGKPIFGGVNSFGAGGTNAHVALQEYVPTTLSANGKTKEKQSDLSLLTISAKSDEALKANVKNYISFLAGSAETLRDICWSAAARRSALPMRLTVAGRSKEEMIANLEAFLNDETRPGMTHGTLQKGVERKLGFIFSGQGPQWYAMGRELIEKSPVFKNTILKIESLFSKVADWSLLEEMSRDEETTRISDTRIAQPAIMAIQIALTDLWKSWGISPEGVVGHSIGEVAAAYAAGALTLEQAVEVIYHRSREQNKATGKGKMLAAALSLDEAKKAISGYEEKISIAAINGPAMVALSGDADALEMVEQELAKKDIFHRYLRVTVPFHCHHMEPLKDELITSLKDLKPSVASLPLYSTVTGKKENGLHLTSDYWYRNVRETVYFTDALQAMIDDGFNTFIEIAPHPALTVGAQDLLDANQVKNSLIAPSLRRKEDEELTIAGSLGLLHVNGLEIDWSKFFGTGCRFVKLPYYAWSRQRYWFETDRHKKMRMGEDLHPFLSDFRQSIEDKGQFIWDLNISKRYHPYLEDHKVEGSVVFPATGHLEAVQAIAAESFKDAPVFLEGVRLESALFFGDEDDTEVRVEVYSDEGHYAVYSRKAGENAEWTKHSYGRINHMGDRFEQTAVNLSELKGRVTDQISVPDFYVELKEDGLNYGESFRGIKKLYRGAGEVLSAVSLSHGDAFSAEQYLVHPALLDACLHSIFAAKERGEGGRGVYLPVAVESYKVFKKAGDKVWCYIKVKEASDERLCGDYILMDEEGDLVCEMKGLTCKYLEGSRSTTRNQLYHGMYEYEWTLVEEAKENPQLEELAANGVGENFLIFADKNEYYKDVLASLKGHGVKAYIVNRGETFSAVDDHHYVVNPRSAEHIDKLLKYLKSLHVSFDKILYLWPVDCEFDESISAEALEAQQLDLTFNLINLLKNFVAQEMTCALIVVTRSVEQISESDKCVNFSQAPVYGLARVMSNEYPLTPVRTIDIPFDAQPTDTKALAAVIAEDPKRAKAMETAIREGKKYYRRLKANSVEEDEGSYSKEQSSLAFPYKAKVKEYGVMDGVVFQEFGRKALLDHEVEIETRAAALNFKDIMNVMGLLADEAVQGGIAGKNLGLECSGVVSRIGAKVRSVKPGDAVVAWSADSFAGYTVTPEHCVAPKPRHLSFEEASTITVVYLTAHYGLNYLARMSEEDTVLIHSAAGGVGLAAIQLARIAGARIIATAGSEEKRSYLRALGIKDVFDSRSLDFADQVKKATNGRGVDIVLNSLTGKSITQSIKCMAPFGRFVEIGKADIYANMRMPLKRFGENLSYHAVDLDRLMLQKPKLAARLYHELTGLFKKYAIEAHPLKLYHVSELPEALSYLSKGKHIGKVAVYMDERKALISPPAELTLNPEASYLITGGASGFGLELARWFAGKGAKHLVLVSRSGAKTEYDRKAIHELSEAGVNVKLARIDITDGKVTQALIDEIMADMPPLKGIVHGAAVLNDAPIPAVDEQKHMSVFRPKVLGAWNLHRATARLQLDFFLMLSSISSAFGIPGQASYSSANNFLDKLAAYRQSKGLAGTSVNLGLLGDYAGMTKDGGHMINVLANQGWLQLTFKEVTDKLERLLVLRPVQRTAAIIDWKRFKDFFIHLNDDFRYAHILNHDRQGAGAGRSGDSMIDQALALQPSEQSGFIQDKILEALAKILGSSPDRIDREAPITKIGLDSLMLNQLRNWIQQKMEINFPLMKIAKGPSIPELANQLLDEIFGAKEPSTDKDLSGIANDADLEVINKWIVRNKKNTQPVKKRMFCFHPVGAGASMFSHFLYNPPKDTDVMALQLPGRENRKDEKPYEDIHDLIKDLAEVLKPYMDLPFAIYGHSFGGIIGFELIRYIRKHYHLEPSHFFISGTIAPQLTTKWKERDVISKTAIANTSDEKLLALMTYIDDVDFLKQILPVMKRDMPLIMGYPYEEDQIFNFPITAFAADKDEVVFLNEIEQWRAQTTDSFFLEVMEGDHWFLSRNKERILQRVSEALDLVVI